MEREKSDRKCDLNQIQGTINDEVSSFKIVASQLVVVFPIICLRIYFGIGIGFTIILVPELSKGNDAEIDVTLDELTWFSSYCFVGPVAAICGGFIAQLMGVRRLLLLSYLLYILTGVIFYYADNVAMILSAQAIAGFTGGITEGPSYTYIAEITQPKLRSIAMAITNLSVLFGTFLSTLLGNLIYWRMQALVNLIFPIVGFMFIHFIPESPQWLSSKNRFEDAEKSLARLRGWTKPESVKAELYSSINTTHGAISSLEKRIEWKKRLSLFLDKSFYVPLSIMSCLFFLSVFNGPLSISMFSVFVFNEIKSPIDGHTASVVVSTISIVAAFVYMFTVRFLRQRKLTLVSVFINFVCFTIAAILLYLTNSNQLTGSEIYSWFITISLLTTTFADNIGLGKIIFFLNSELFPQNMRYIGAGTGNFMAQIMSAILGKIFFYVVKATTFSGCLLLFVIINIVGFIAIYFILPETEGVSLHEIEEHFAGEQNLKDNKTLQRNV